MMTHAAVNAAHYVMYATWKKKMMSEYTKSGESYEDAKMLMRRVHEFFLPDIDVIHEALIDAYEYGYKQGIESEGKNNEL